jgi:hypothetical protein
MSTSSTTTLALAPDSTTEDLVETSASTRPTNHAIVTASETNSIPLLATPNGDDLTDITTTTTTTTTVNKRKRCPSLSAMDTLVLAVKTKQCAAASHVVDISTLAEITEIKPLTETFEILVTLAENAVRFQKGVSSSPVVQDRSAEVSPLAVLDGQTAVLDLIEYLSVINEALCTNDRQALELYRPLVSRAQSCLRSVVQNGAEHRKRARLTDGKVQEIGERVPHIDPRIVLPFLENKFSSTPTIASQSHSSSSCASSEKSDDFAQASRATKPVVGGGGVIDDGTAGPGPRTTRGAADRTQSPMKLLRSRVFRAVDIDWDQRKNLIQELLKDVDDRRRSAMEAGAAQVRGYVRAFSATVCLLNSCVPVSVSIVCLFDMSKGAPIAIVHTRSFNLHNRYLTIGQKYLSTYVM